MLTVIFHAWLVAKGSDLFPNLHCMFEENTLRDLSSYWTNFIDPERQTRQTEVKSMCYRLLEVKTLVNIL